MLNSTTQKARISPEISIRVSKETDFSHQEKTHSWGAWAKAGLVFGITTGAYFFTKGTGILDWIASRFSNNIANSNERNAVIAADDSNAVSAAISRINSVDQILSSLNSDSALVKNDKLDLAEFEELNLAKMIKLQGVNDPSFVKNELNIEVGKNKVLNTTDLLVTDADTSNTNLIYSASDVQHGNFTKDNVTAVTWSQQDVIDGKISFIHDGSTIAPTYALSVTDGTTIAGPARPTVTFWDDFALLNEGSFANMGVGSSGRALLTDGGFVLIRANKTADSTFSVYAKTLYANITNRSDVKVIATTTGGYDRKPEGLRIAQVDANKCLFTYIDYWSFVHGTMYAGFIDLNANLIVGGISLSFSVWNNGGVNIATVGSGGSKYYVVAYTPELATNDDPCFQEFDTSNNKYGSLTQICSPDCTLNQESPYIVPLDSSCFLSVYTDGATSNPYKIMGKRFYNNGNAIDSAPFQITSSERQVMAASLEGSNSDRYVITLYPTSTSCSVRIYNKADSSPYSSTVKLADNCEGFASIAALQNGGFIILYWLADGSYTQIFDANGNIYGNATFTNVRNTTYGDAREVFATANGGYASIDYDNTDVRIFGYDTAPRLNASSISLIQNQTLPLNISHFNVIEDTDQYAQVQYSFSNITHGQFEKLSEPGIAYTNFTQQELVGGQIKFVTDGGNISPAMNVAVSDGILSTSPVPVNVNFNDIPVISTISKNSTEDSIVNFTLADFTSHFSDIYGNGLAKIQITDLPLNGTLKLNTTNVTLNQEILAGDLGKLTFTPDSNWNGVTSFSWKGSDGQLYSANSANVTLTVTAINDAPVLIGSGGIFNYTENSGGVPIDSAITLTDIDSTTMQGATVSISTGYAIGEDYLIFSNQSGITGTFVPATGVLTLSGNASITQYQTALRSVQYNNTAENPSTTQRAISFKVNDGALDSNVISRSIRVISVNDAPTVSSMTKNGLEDVNITFTALDFTGHFTDIDGGNLTQIQITSLPTNTSGILTLNGDPVFLNQEIIVSDLSKLVFSPAANWNGQTSFVWKGYDGQTYSTNSASVNITITAVNDAPVLTGSGGTVVYLESSDPVIVDSSISISDVDSLNLTSGLVSISNGISGEDYLYFKEQNGIVGLYNPDTSTLNLAGVTSVSNYQTALRSVKYEDVLSYPSNVIRNVTFMVSDGYANSNSVQRSIRVVDLSENPDSTWWKEIGWKIILGIGTGVGTGLAGLAFLYIRKEIKNCDADKKWNGIMNGAGSVKERNAYIVADHMRTQLKLDIPDPSNKRGGDFLAVVFKTLSGFGENNVSSSYGSNIDSMERHNLEALITYLIPAVKKTMSGYKTKSNCCSCKGADKSVNSGEECDGYFTELNNKVSEIVAETRRLHATPHTRRLASMTIFNNRQPAPNIEMTESVTTKLQQSDENKL